MKNLRVLLTGGGTGGHIYPLIAVADELKKQAEPFGIDLDIRYFGGAREYAAEIIGKDIQFAPIFSSKLRRYWSILNLLDIFKFFLSIIQLFWKIFWFMPDVIFSKGGPGALAVVIVGRFYLIPVVVHESDSVPGLTNKISGRFARKVFFAFFPEKNYFNVKKIEVVGNPVRNELFRQAEMLKAAGEDARIQARKNFGLDVGKPVLLMLGGSQGAEILNDFILENLEILLRNFQILHQVGKNNFEIYKKEFEFATKGWSDIVKNGYNFAPFFGDNLADALIAADIVISRAGAGTIFELAAFSKPAVLVPLSNSANDHQRKNAYIYKQTGAAIIIQEENLLGNLVIDEINKILNNKQVLEEMGAAARSFYRLDAAAVIAKYLLTFIK